MSFIKKVPKNYLAIIPSFKEEKVKNFTTLVLTLITLSFFGLFAISPTLSTIAQLKKQLADNKLVDQKLSEKITNLGTLQQKYKLLENELYLVALALPQKPNSAYFLGQIQALSESSGLSITSIQTYQVDLTRPKDLKDKYSSFAFAIEGEAKSYQDIATFAKSILNFDRLISVDMLTATSKTEKGVLKMNIRGKAHFKK